MIDAASRQDFRGLLMRQDQVLEQTARKPGAVHCDLETLAARTQFAWIRKAVGLVDEIARLIRRNIQKTIALDAMILELRAA